MSDVPKVSRRADRVKACELAAICMQGHGTELGGSKLMSLVVFFETYISRGADATENEMKMLTHGVRGVKRKNWRVIAGGQMNWTER